MSKLFNLSFQNDAGAPDSPGAITDDNVVYAQATQSTKTLLIFENGTSRVANNTLAATKVGLGLVSIGTPTAVNGNVWSGGEVVINQSYLTQVYNGSSSRRVQLNWPSTSPIVFTTTATVADITAAALAAEKGYADFVCTLTQTGTTAPTINVIKNEFSTGVTTVYVVPGEYYLSFDAMAPTVGGGLFSANNANISASIINGGTPTAAAINFAVYRDTGGSITVKSLSGSTPTDALLSNAMLQIRLYY